MLSSGVKSGMKNTLRQVSDSPCAVSSFWTTPKYICVPKWKDRTRTFWTPVAILIFGQLRQTIFRSCEVGATVKDLSELVNLPKMSEITTPDSSSMNIDSSAFPVDGTGNASENIDLEPIMSDDDLQDFLESGDLFPEEEKSESQKVPDSDSGFTITTFEVSMSENCEILYGSFEVLNSGSPHQEEEDTQICPPLNWEHKFDNVVGESSALLANVSGSDWTSNTEVGLQFENAECHGYAENSESSKREEVSSTTTEEPASGVATPQVLGAAAHKPEQKRKRKSTKTKAKASPPKKERMDKSWFLPKDKGKDGWQLNPKDYIALGLYSRVKKWVNDKKGRLLQKKRTIHPECLAACNDDPLLVEFQNAANKIMVDTAQLIARAKAAGESEEIIKNIKDEGGKKMEILYLKRVTRMAQELTIGGNVVD